MKRCRRSLSLLLVLLLLLWVPVTSSAETKTNWDEENYGPSRLTDGECFPMKTADFVGKFNQKYSLNGSGMEFIVEGTRCNLYIAKEQMNIFLQFMDTSDTNFQFGSGLAREKWNKVRIYIATDDSSTDLEYLLSLSGWFDLLSEILGHQFDSKVFQDNTLPNTGSSDYPRYVHEEQGLQYVLEAYDDKIMFGGEVTTTYSASIELLSGTPESFVENGRFTLSPQEYAERLKDILGDEWTVVTTRDTTATETPTVVTDFDHGSGAGGRIVYGGRSYMADDPQKPGSFELMTVMIMPDPDNPTGILEIGSALVQAADPKADATRTITLITDLVVKAGQQSDAKETRNGIEYTYSGVTMPVAHLFIISVAE